MSTQDQPIVLPDVAVVRAIVEHNFPDLWPAVDLGLSTAATLLLAENTNPTAVIYVGGPSTGKTTVATMFDGAMIEVNGPNVRVFAIGPINSLPHRSSARPPINQQRLSQRWICFHGSRTKSSSPPNWLRFLGASQMN